MLKAVLHLFFKVLGKSRCILYKSEYKIYKWVRWYHTIGKGVSLENELGKPGIDCNITFFLLKASWEASETYHEVRIRWLETWGRWGTGLQTERIGYAVKSWDHWRAFGHRVRSPMLVFHICMWTCIWEWIWTDGAKSE